MKQKKQPGFSLIELMVVVSIIAILAKIAYPTYINSQQKSRRTDAKAALMQLSGFMERQYVVTGCYNPGVDLICGTSDDSTAPALPFTVTPQQGKANYDLSLSAITASSYTLQAVPKLTTTDPLCNTLTLGQSGTKTPTTSGCW